MRTLEKFGWSPQYTDTFLYHRKAGGLYIKKIKDEVMIFIEGSDWEALLREIEGSGNKTFGLSATGGANPPNDSLYDIIDRVLKKRKIDNGQVSGSKTKLSDSDSAAVCSILFHEGSLDLYSGPLGPKEMARIVFQKSE